MKIWKMLSNLALGLATAGLLVPNWAKAEMISQPSQQVAAPAILDIALAHGGTLSGQVVTAEGAPLRGEAVSILRDGQEIARTQTDETGRYEIHGLKGGVHQVATTKGVATCRLWSGNAAPPSAQPGALLVVGDTVRGHVSHPGVWIALLIGGAVGLALLLGDDDKKKPASNVD